jgi:hypothetical protein
LQSKTFYLTFVADAKQARDRKGDINKQASISCLLALLPLRGKQAVARDRRQDKS